MKGFWAGKRVFVTGHTGFKGAWLAFWLAELGAKVSGVSLAPDTQPNLHDLLGIGRRGRFIHADIYRERDRVEALIQDEQPEIVLHLAAQALVRPSYAAPVDTFATNVLGTVALLDAVRRCEATKAVLVVTSDKAYENREWVWGYRENDALGGRDPYSASKGCAEIAAASMRRSYFGPGGHAARIATVRAGNVIGGGDWSADRLVPDIIRGCLGGEGVVTLRNPAATRPWQHVLDALFAYLMIAERLHAAEPGLDDAWNIGPDASDTRPVSEVAAAIVSALGRGSVVVAPQAGAPHEATLLTLDCAKARAHLGWRPRLDFAGAVATTAAWYGAWSRGYDVASLTLAQIAAVQETAR